MGKWDKTATAALHKDLYVDYKAIKERFKEKYPEFFCNMPKSYFIAEIAKKHGLTHNYVLSIINEWFRNEEEINKIIFIKKLNDGN